MKRRKQSKKQKAKKKREAYLATRHGSFESRLRNCLYARRKDAKKHDLEFAIWIENFETATHCLLLPETKFCFTNARGNLDTSMSIDRIDPTKGYTPENTWLICQKANRIKNNATFEEFETIYLNWKAELERRKK